MGRAFALFLLLLWLCRLATAQTSEDRLQVFGGFSIERVALCGPRQGNCNSSTAEGPSTTTYHGWNVAVTGFVYKSFGITADFAGHYGNSSIPVGGSVHTSDRSYLFGPVYVHRMKTISPLAHALFGIVTRRVDPFDITPNPFAWMVGGGLDIGAIRHLNIRVVQFDYERLNLPGSNAPPVSVSGFRYSGGIVLKF